MNSDAKLGAILAMCLTIIAAIFFTSIVIMSGRDLGKPDAKASKVCEPYPTFAAFTHDDVKYAVCVVPDAGLVAKKVSER